VLKDITIGQFFPGTSPVHRLDPRVKLCLTIAYVVLLFMAKNAVSLVTAAALLFFAYPLSKIPGRMILKSLKPILPVVILTALMNMLFIDGETVFSWWIIEISDKGLTMAAFMVARIICLIAGTSLLTYTTSPISLTDGIERLFSPLNRFKVPVHEISMMMTIALRFIPTLIEETDRIMSAQKARGADLESGGLMQRIRALTPILIPLFVSAFSRAIDLALAMECRCYRGGEGRTHLHSLKATALDFYGAVFLTVFIAGVIWGNIAFPAML
jgi:energy-coupling factor transport system permease protein